MRLSNFFVCSMLLSVFTLLASGCGAGLSSGPNPRNADSQIPESTETGGIDTGASQTSHGPFVWKSDWTDQLREFVAEDTYIQQSMPQDFATYACPRYFSLNDAQKRDAIVHFFYAIAKAETDLNQFSRYLETSMGKDPITGQRVYSEGLLQLSYQDGQTYGCDFSWPNDRSLAPFDHGKTIFDSRRQFRCGVHILHFQIAHLNRIFPSHAHYWEVLKPTSRRFSVVKNAMKELAICRQ